MGSSGSYNVSLSIQYSIKQSTPNTIENCEAALATRKYLITTEVPATEDLIRQLVADNVNFVLEYGKDCESWESDDYSLDELIEALDEYYDSDNYTVNIKRPASAEDLTYVNLNLLANIKGKELPADFTISEGLCSVSESIYYESDNSSYNSTSISASLLAKLAIPEAKLVLEGDGSTY